MATVQTSAMAQAAQTLAQPVKTRKPASAGQKTKPQPEKIIASWDVVPKYVAAACEGEAKAERQWVRLSDALWMLGVRCKDFDEIKGQKLDDRYTDMYKKIRGYVWKTFPKNAQRILGMPTIAVDPNERPTREAWLKKSRDRMAKVVSYLRKHEGVESRGAQGPQSDTQLADSLVKSLQGMKDRIKNAKESKITFDVPETLAALDTAIDVIKTRV